MLNCGMGFKETGSYYPEKLSFSGKSIINRSDARKKAYRYICGCLKNMSGSPNPVIKDSILPLDELLELKEGLSDPSPRMIMLLRAALGTSLSESEIHANLVSPFIMHKHSVGGN